MSHSAEDARVMYSVWYGMLNRCYNTHEQNYKYYGGRGIKVCDRWRKSYRNFWEDMGTRPTGYTLDRIDNNGDYEPGNCRWATRSQQQRNTRLNRNLTLNGQTRCLSEWAAIIGIDPVSLRQRVRLHGAETALTMQKGKRARAHVCCYKELSSTGYKGVYAHQSGKYEACCRANGKKHYLGLFTDPLQAAKAYDAKAVEVFGVDARLNFPVEAVA